MKILSLFILFFVFTALPQSKDADAIIKRLKEGFSKVKDYEVDVNIKVDVDFIKVPESHAKIFYKQPDKMHFESENFAMLPKEGMDFSPMSMLKGEWTAYYQKEDNVDGHQVSVIKVIPISEHADIVLTTFWIDQKENIIRRVESNTKTSGSFTIDLKYDDAKKDFYLPKNMIFTFNIEKMNVPKALSSDSEPESKKKEKKPTSGKVYISYFNYKVNQGIPDNIFTDKKKK